MDVGETAAAGAVQSDGSGGYISTSGGRSIGGTADSFNYFYRPLSGDGQVMVRITGLQSADVLAKAGVMLRENLSPDSRNAMMQITSGQGSAFQWRMETGARAEQTAGSTNATAPIWLKIVRHGDWMGGFSSADGNNWKLVDWQTLRALPFQVYVGVAVAGGSNTAASASFDQLSTGPVDLSEIVNPLVGSGDGLWASYFPNRHLYGVAVTNRVDKQVDLGLLHLSAAGVTNKDVLRALCQKFIGMDKKDELSARWVGEVQAQFTEPYTIYAENSDGVRLWINEELLIDNWDSHHAEEDSATVNLVAGQRYLIRVEYYQNFGDLVMKLRWSSPSTPKRIIPTSQLYSQPTDTDANGLPDAWEQHYFGQIGVDPNADADADGLSNLKEWQLHTDPVNPLSWDVPNAWTHGDIEDGYGCSNQGRASYNAGVFSISSAGKDIWGRGDHFHYLYRAIGTNGEIVARMTDILGTNRYGNAGVMMRESLESASRNAMQLISVSNGMSFQWRAAFWDRTVTEMWQTNPPMPYWLKLARNNDWVGGYVSGDGTNWSLFEWETFKGLAPKVFMGLAVAATNPRTNCPDSTVTARFDQVDVGAATNGEVMDPAVGNGDGLLANFRSDSLQYLPGVTNMVEWAVDRIWIHYAPPGTLNPDSYGVCWSGELQAQFTEPYTFVLGCQPNNWVRLWINDQLVIDFWRKPHRNTRPRGTINLVAGQRYLIRVEMFNNHEKGVAQLWWRSPSTPQRIVPQSQLYSHPLDADGNGLPDTWENLYFGHLGVNPAADPDGDGLSNLQEYQYHTNPLKSDSDNDGIPDAWEVAHGLDPQFNDAGLDYDNAGWSNLQKYYYGLDPYNPDLNGDGLPDAFEVRYLGLDVNTSYTNQTVIAAQANGAMATNLLGNWQVEGSDIYCLDRRGGVDFNLTTTNGDKYVLNIVGTQNRLNPFEAKFKLLLGVDGQTLGYYNLNAGYGTNGEVTLVLPFLRAGSHLIHVFWDGVTDFSSLRIKQVKLFGISGSDANNNGIKDWAERMMADESGVDATNTIINSYTFPLCLEGRDPYPAMMAATNNLTNSLSATATTDGRWYVNTPLAAGTTQAVFQVSYQNGGLTEARQVRWQRINLLTFTNNISIRKGDSLWLTALPAGATNGSIQVTYGTNTVTGTAAKGVSCKFSVAGTYTVTGSCVLASGAPQTASITVDVAQQNLPNVKPAAWTRMPRTADLSNLAPKAVLQVDSRLNCYIGGTNSSGGLRLTLETEQNEERTILARLGTNGPVLDSTRISGFDLWGGSQASLKVTQTYPDGSQLVEMVLVSSPVEPNVTFLLEPIASGVIFDDGTITKTLDATSFDALGQCVVKFIRPASVKTSVCHTIKAFQGNTLIGYRF